MLSNKNVVIDLKAYKYLTKIACMMFSFYTSEFSFSPSILEWKIEIVINTVKFAIIIDFNL